LRRKRLQPLVDVLTACVVGNRRAAVLFGAVPHLDALRVTAVRLSVCLHLSSVCPPVFTCPSVCPPVSLLDALRAAAVRLSVCLYLSVCPSVCLASRRAARGGLPWRPCVLPQATADQAARLVAAEAGLASERAARAAAEASVASDREAFDRLVQATVAAREEEAERQVAAAEAAVEAARCV
jgi:hypothetical protein